MSEAEALQAFVALLGRDILSRIGAIVRPNTAGSSTLAALSCPCEHAEAVAAIVSAEPFVNHNYERDHQINLWFVVAAPSEERLAETLHGITTKTGCNVLDLRLENPYHIDLGFSLTSRGSKYRESKATSRLATLDERRLLAAIEDGLPVTPRPFATVAQYLGVGEADVIASIQTMLRDGVISRFGCIVRHRQIGFVANAMAVWDVPDGNVDDAGMKLAREEGVTLCYRRNRQLPDWRYNLFAMIHGKHQENVRQQINTLIKRNDLGVYAHDVLFSTRCFTQRGARFSDCRKEAAA